MGNRIKKENLDLLLSYNRTLSRAEISEILQVTDSLARTYRSIMDNYDIIFDKEPSLNDNEIVAENVRMAKQRQKFQDSNRIERKSFREYARIENSVSEYVQELIQVFDENPYKVVGVTHEANDSAVGVIQLSDLHFNELIDIKTNKYDFIVASKRIQKLVFEATQYFKIHNIKDVFVFMTGDLMNSDRRLDELLAMATNRSKATFISVQILEHMLVSLNTNFNVHVAGVVGNESRISKDYNWNNEIISDNYDFTIFNVLRYKLKDTVGIKFLGLSDRHEEVVAVGNKNFLLVHGHQIGKDISKDISKLIRKYAQTDIDIDFVIFGHIHEAMMSDTYSRSSSLCGSNSYAEGALLLIGRASQNVFIVFKTDRIDGIKVDLQDTCGYSGYDTQSWQDAYNPKSVEKAQKRETILRITI